SARERPHGTHDTTADRAPGRAVPTTNALDARSTGHREGSAGVNVAAVLSQRLHALEPGAKAVPALLCGHEARNTERQRVAAQVLEAAARVHAAVGGDQQRIQRSVDAQARRERIVDAVPVCAVPARDAHGVLGAREGEPARDVDLAAVVYGEGAA